MTNDQPLSYNEQKILREAQDRATLDYLVGQKMGELAKKRYVILLKDTHMPMRDPGFDRPFMTANKRQADHIRDEACRHGFTCEVFTVEEAMPMILKASDKQLKKKS